MPRFRSLPRLAALVLAAVFSLAGVVNAQVLPASADTARDRPDSEALATTEAPVLGLYGEDDARVNETIPPAQERMEALGKFFQVEIFDGAGHGFLRAQDGRGGRNLAASSQAWPMTVRFFREHLGS